MARRPYRDALNDQPLECRLIPFTSDEIRDRTEGLSAARPWLYFPFRNAEEVSQEVSLEDSQEDSADSYQ
jgi:hypothetical protein